MYQKTFKIICIYIKRAKQSEVMFQAPENKIRTFKTKFLKSRELREKGVGYQAIYTTLKILEMSVAAKIRNSNHETQYSLIMRT